VSNPCASIVVSCPLTRPIASITTASRSIIIANRWATNDDDDTLETSETTVATSVSDPAIYFQNNTVNGVTLLEAMRRHGVKRLVFSSTAATYGEPVTVPMTEDHPQQPINAYGESKLMFERMIAWYHRAYGLKSASFRYFNAAGATEARGEAHRHESHLIPLVLDVAAGDRPSVNVYGSDYPTRDGTCVRDYVHVTDLGEAHALALSWMARHDRSGAFNLGTGKGWSVAEVIEVARRITGRPIAVARGPRRAGDPPVLVARAERARAELGWEPRLSAIETIVETAWAWRRVRDTVFPG
jgi:UDP-glucose 4-epimerase